MADSAFWRNLAAEFRALPNAGILRADWDYQMHSDPSVSTWSFAGPESSCIQFQALARRGASELQINKITDLLIKWLEILKSFNAQLGHLSYYVAVNDDGTEGPHHLTGSISPVCLISADYCNRLESEAIQQEFEAKQRNDPRNWSPLRAQFEAFKKIKELHSGPHERIPESLVRDTLAQKLGIRPEEVTPKQINLAVVDLLRDYPAITLVPTTQSPSQCVPEVPSISEEPSAPNPDEGNPPVASEESVPTQLQRLRHECRWTIEDLSAATNISSRQVARHLSGEFKPLARNISAYERAFCKRLKRQVVIK